MFLNLQVDSQSTAPSRTSVLGRWIFLRPHQHEALHFSWKTSRACASATTSERILLAVNNWVNSTKLESKPKKLFGCSIGPDSIAAAENVLEETDAKRKELCQKQTSCIPSNIPFLPPCCPPNPERRTDINPFAQVPPYCVSILHSSVLMFGKSRVENRHCISAKFAFEDLVVFGVDFLLYRGVGHYSKNLSLAYCRRGSHS